jgi:hypothetical protein
MNLAHTVQNLWPFRGRLRGIFRGVPDPRSDREIDDDLDAEFAFHLEQSKRDLMEQGKTATAAALMARERFGDLERYKKQCRRIALKERIMLQRVNFVMMIVVMLMVVGVGVQVWTTQRYNTLALQDITAQIAKMRIDAGAEARGNGSSAAGAANGLATKVLIEGAVDRAGWYDVGATDDSVYLHEFVDQARPTADSASVYYTRANASRPTHYTLDSLRNGSQKIVLGPGDRIRVAVAADAPEGVRNPAALAAASEYKSLNSGEWRQFDPTTWQLIPRGTKIVLLSKSDIRNIAGVPGGVATLLGDQSEIGLLFNPLSSSPTNLLLYQSIDGKTEVTESRWLMDDDGNLTVNFAPIRPTMGQPLVFRRVSESEELVNRLGSIVTDLRQMKFESGSRVFERSAPSIESRPPLPSNASAMQDSVNDPTGEQHDSENPVRRAPFRGVKWADWTPFVDVQGRWYELLTIDGIPVSVVLDHLRQAHGGEERRWFSERLTDVLTALGRNVGDAVKLEVRDPATGTRLSIDQAAFTKENHERVQAVNKAATDNGEDFPMFVQN